MKKKLIIILLIVVDILAFNFLLIALRWFNGIPIDGINSRVITECSGKRKIKEPEKEHVISHIKNLNFDTNLVSFKDTMGIVFSSNPEDDLDFAKVYLTGKYVDVDSFDEFLKMLDISPIEFKESDGFYEIPNVDFYNCKLMLGVKNKFYILCDTSISQLSNTISRGHSEEEVVRQKTTLQYLLTLNEIYSKTLLRKDLVLQLYAFVILILLNIISILILKKDYFIEKIILYVKS